MAVELTAGVAGQQPSSIFTCGAPVSLTMSCEQGHGPLSVRDVEALPGPGARRVAA